MFLFIIRNKKVRHGKGWEGIGWEGWERRDGKRGTEWDGKGGNHDLCKCLGVND